MNFTPITSSNIDAAAWDERGLFLRFKSGAVYLYLNAPEQVLKDLLAAESAGKFFHAHIKMHYKFIVQEAT